MLKLSFPCTIVLTDSKGFLSQSEEQGESNLQMAQLIAERGMIRLYGVGYSESGVTLYDTGIPFNGESIGLTEAELGFFTLRNRGLV